MRFDIHKEYRSRKALELFREFKPDLVLIAGIQRFKAEVLPELHEASTVLYWFTESETRIHEIAHELPWYHHLYFISTFSLEHARNLGYANGSMLLHAVNTTEFYPLDLPKIYDWCFVGQWHPRRQEYAEGLAQVSRKFAIYGPKWRKRTWDKPALWWGIKGKGIWEEKLNRLYNQTRVVINISVWGGENRGSHGVNMRLLEVPATRTQWRASAHEGRRMAGLVSRRQRDRVHRGPSRRQRRDPRRIAARRQNTAPRQRPPRRTQPPVRRVPRWPAASRWQHRAPVRRDLGHRAETMSVPATRCVDRAAERISWGR